MPDAPLRRAGFACGLVGLGGALVGIATGRVPRAAVGLAVGLAALLLLADGLATGVVWTRGAEVARAERPAAFWLACAAYAVLAGLMAVVVSLG